MSHYRTIVNILILLVILYEIQYIIDTSLLINTFKVKRSFGHVTSYKIIGTLIILTAFIVAYVIVTRALKIDGLLFALFTLISTPLYLNYVLSKHHNITDKKKPIKLALDEMKTGDFIIFETPRHITNYFVLVPVLALSICHIGIIVRDGDKIYMLDSDINDYYCEHSKRVKNGVLLTELTSRIPEYDDYYIIQNNLHKYINPDDLLKFIGKYADKSYMEDNVNCMTFVLLFLHELKLSAENLFKKHNMFVDYRLLLDEKIYSRPFEYDLWKMEI